MKQTFEETLAAHKDGIEEIVADALQVTFKTYFGIDIYKAGLRLDKDLKDGIFCSTTIRDPNSAGAVTISFEKPFLLELSNMIYPPNEASKKESFEACAKEIGNIVSARVKTYLNDHGHDLTIGIPSIVYQDERKAHDIKFSFFIEHSRLFVDIDFNAGVGVCETVN